MASRCQSEGCKAEVALKTLDPAPRFPIRSPQPPFANGAVPGGSARVPSKYCKKHTCDHFYRSDGCDFKKVPHDSVCAVHAQCPIPGCLEGKGQYLELEQDSRGPPKYLRYDFCSLHKCTEQRCRFPRARGPLGKPKLFCEQHSCQADDCTNRSLDQFNFCPEHKCMRCPTIVEGSHALCSIHVKCALLNCNQAKHRIGKDSAYHNFCIEHASCQTPTCKGFKTSNSLHCLRHTCSERDCEASTEEHQLCANHRCDASGCENPKGWKRNRKDREHCCPLHTCRNENCQKEVGTMQLFCKLHECSNLKCKEEALLEQLCETHLRTQYEAAGRAKAKAEMLEMRQPTMAKGNLNRDLHESKYEYKRPARSSFKEMDDDRHSHGMAPYSDKDEFGTSQDQGFGRDSDEQSVHSWIRTS